MLPHLGAGAGQAIEDAYLLAKLLSHPQLTNQNVEVGAPFVSIRIKFDVFCFFLCRLLLRWCFKYTMRFVVLVPRVFGRAASALAISMRDMVSAGPRLKGCVKIWKA